MIYLKDEAGNEFGMSIPHAYPQIFVDEKGVFCLKNERKTYLKNVNIGRKITVERTGFLKLKRTEHVEDIIYPIVGFDYKSKYYNVIDTGLKGD